MHQFIIANNHALFHLRWKENLLNYQKVSKYYEDDCTVEEKTFTTLMNNGAGSCGSDKPDNSNSPGTLG